MKTFKELVTELKDATIRSYHTKAKADVKDLRRVKNDQDRYAAMHRLSSNDNDYHPTHSKVDRKIANRSAGIKQAAKRIKKADSAAEKAHQDSLVHKTEKNIGDRVEDPKTGRRGVVSRKNSGNYKDYVDVDWSGPKGGRSTHHQHSLKHVNEEYTFSLTKTKNESVEQVDELKASTLGSYIKKASKDANDLAYIQGAAGSLNAPFERKKKHQRERGIETATDKLVKGQVTKEDVELGEEVHHVLLRGGSIGDKKFKYDVRSGAVHDSTHDTAEWAKLRAKRLNKNLAPGDKKRYITRPDSKVLFTTRVNEHVGLDETSYEKDMNPNKPVIVKGVKGMKSTPFTKKFKNQAAYEKWVDSDAAGDYTIYQVMNEDVELDELNKSTLQSVAKKAKIRSQKVYWNEYEKASSVDKPKIAFKANQDVQSSKLAHKMLKKGAYNESREEIENIQYIDEVLQKSDPASKWVNDFVKSDNPKFQGKSKKERINMALGAYYGKQKETNESFTDKQINQLKTAYAGIENINPSSDAYNKLIKQLDSASPKDLEKLASANIKFVSSLARNRVNRAKLYNS